MNTSLALVTSLMLAAVGSPVWAASQPPDKDATVLQGARKVIGTVEEVKADQIKVNTGEVQPRFIPLNQAKEKGLPEIKKGDQLEITVNDQNLIVDYHLAGEAGLHAGEHQVVRGQIAQPLVVGHERAVIRTKEGKEESYEIRTQARSKVASIPTGLDAVFLVDETNKIVDVTFGSKEAVEKAAEAWKRKSPLKGAYKRIEGTVTQPLSKNRITIRTAEGKERPYEVMPLVHDKLTNLSQGDSVVLLVDNDNKVMDVASTQAGRER